MSNVYKDSGLFIRPELSADKKRISVFFSPTSGPMAGKELNRSAFVSNLDKTTIETIKSLKEDEEITIDITINEVGDKKYRNLVGISRGITKQTFTKKSTTNTKSSGDYNDRAAKGQALNLAMQIAIAEGRQHDTEYVLSLIPTMIKLGEQVQGGSNANGTKFRAASTSSSKGNEKKTTSKSNVKVATGESSAVSPDTSEINLDELLEL